jgi:uncharacterized protein
MPTIERNDRATGPAVTGFAGTLIKVDGIARASGVILTPDAVFDWDGGDFEIAVTDPLPEFIVLGTGASLERPAPAIVAAFEARGIDIEAMDTRAAARAWGVLRAEGRWISAALRPL